MTAERRGPRPAIDLAARPAIDLAGALLEPSTLTLQGPDGRAALEPRVMQVLVALADAAGTVLSREALLQSCWNGSVVGDDALHRAVAGARRALRVAGAAQWAIETIPRVGYRLVGSTAGAPAAAAALAETVVPATAVTSAAAPAPPVTPVPPVPLTAGPPPAHTLPRRSVMVAGALAAAATAAAVGGVWQLRRSATVPYEVQALLAQGQQAMRLATAEAAAQAASRFEQATRLAPRHALAWGQLALAHLQLAEFADRSQLADRLTSTATSAARALTLDPGQPDALTARALLVPAFGQWARVEDALQAVLERNPNHLPALDALALTLASTGVAAASYPMRLKTVEQDPLNAAYNFRAVYSHWMNGQVAAADLAGERGLELWPRHFPTWLARLSLFRYTGRAERALEMLDATDSRPPMPPAFAALLRLTTAALASGSAAARSNARDAMLLSLAADGPLGAVGATMDLAALGETALALDVTEAYLLERGPLVAGTTWQPGQVRHTDVRRRFTNHLFLPVSAPLRADPRFLAIAHDIGMAAQWARPHRRPDDVGAARPAVGIAAGRA